MTHNNFFTHISKWKANSSNSQIPRFYRQSFDVNEKIFIPYDELSIIKDKTELKNYIPHFFISDEKQSCFADNPQKHSDILDKCYAVFSTDFSVYVNAYSQFNNAIILLSRLIAAMWQSMGRFVIITITWAGEDTYNVAFSNIEEGSYVGISTEGVSDWKCFRKGFLKMLEVIKPSLIFWYDKIPNWVYDVYDKDKVIIVPKRFYSVQKKQMTVLLQQQKPLF